MKTNKVKLSMLLILTLMIGFFSTNVAFAQVDESKAERKEEKIITKIIPKEEPKEEIEVRLPNKLTPKEPTKNTEGSENEEKGNTNKGIATPPSKARATLTENVDNKNAEYEVYRGSQEDREPNKYAADARQFISFKTKSGKTFHLVINHDEASENVMLLTEVSEDDLLNFVEQKEKKEEPIKEITPKVEPEKEEKKPEKEEKKSDFTTYILIFVIGLAVFGGGYYFKVVKRKEEKELRDFEDEANDEEYYSESEYEEDTSQKTESEEMKRVSDENEYEDIDEEDLM